MRLRALAVALLLAGPAAAEVSLPEVGSYFNAFRTAEAEFTQVNADGTISTGTLFIHRPGRVRFEYDEPEDQLVMAGGGQVAIFDGRGSGSPEQYPLSRTPLKIILSDPVDLTRERMVTGHTSDGTTTTVTAQDPENPGQGSIRLVFTDDPVQLRQWVVTNGAGEQTTVILGEMTTGGSLSPRLFNIVQEAERWRR
jgi:outer membrane lipoprotein-sorting protein